MSERLRLTFRHWWTQLVVAYQSDFLCFPAFFRNSFSFMMSLPCCSWSPEAAGTEIWLCGVGHSIAVDAGQHPEGHGGLAGGSGDPRHQGGPHNQDGCPRHLPAEQELPAVLRYLGQAGSDHARYGRFEAAQFWYGFTDCRILKLVLDDFCWPHLSLGSRDSRGINTLWGCLWARYARQGRSVTWPRLAARPSR